MNHTEVNLHLYVYPLLFQDEIFSALKRYALIINSDLKVLCRFKSLKQRLAWFARRDLIKKLSQMYLYLHSLKNENNHINVKLSPFYHMYERQYKRKVMTINKTGFHLYLITKLLILRLNDTEVKFILSPDHIDILLKEIRQSIKSALTHIIKTKATIDYILQGLEKEQKANTYKSIEEQSKISEIIKDIENDLLLCSLFRNQKQNKLYEIALCCIQELKKLEACHFLEEK